MKPLNILIVAEGIPGIPEENRLTGIFELDQAIALKKMGHNVVYLCADTFSLSEHRKLGVYWTSIQSLPVLVISIPIGRRPLNICSEVASGLIYHFVRKEKNLIGSIDVIHSHFYFQGYISIKLKKLFKCPLIVTEHSSRVNNERIPRKLSHVCSIAYNNADSVIAVGSSLRDRIIERFNVSPVVIPNIVQTKIFKKPRITHDGFRFICVANLVPIKNLEMLIHAFSQIKKFGPEITLKIIGDGPLRFSLQELINSLGQGSRITLLGRLNRDEIAGLFSESDCFVLASKSETFGVAYIEAMSSGLPVIATKKGGPVDFVNSNNGVLVDPNDENEIIDAIEYMVDKRDRFINQDISDSVNSQFSDNRIANQLTDVYNVVIQRGLDK